MMEPEALEVTIDASLRQQPFHPFTLVMNDGTKLEVDHPKAVHFFRGFGIFYGPGGRPVFFQAGGVNRVSSDLANPDGVRSKDKAA